MPWECPRGLKAPAVIFYVEDDLTLLGGEAEPDGAGMGMLDDVVQGFLGDAIQAFFLLEGERSLFTQVRLDRQFIAGA